MGTNRDLSTLVDPVAQIAPAAYTASPSDGGDVNLDEYAGCFFAIHVGTHTDGTFTFGFEEADPTTENGDTADTYSDVAAADLIDDDDELTSGELVVSDGSFDDSVVIIGYRGSKKFVRATLTVTGSPTTGAEASVVAYRTDPRHENVTPIVRS